MSFVIEILSPMISIILHKIIATIVWSANTKKTEDEYLSKN